MFRRIPNLLRSYTPRPTRRPKRQRGAMMVLVGSILVVLTGFAVLAIDVGRVFIVRNELQNVADSAALAGANCMMRNAAPSSANCLSTFAPALNWTGAAAKAQAQLVQNAADNRPVSSSGAGQRIEVGYWNLLTGAPSGGTFSSTFSPLTTYDRPAVRVALTQDAGQNGGPIVMLTRIMFGGVDVPMRAQAVAVISSPGSVAPGSLIPLAINKCMFDKYWNSTTGTPVIYTGNPVDPYGLSTVGKPWVVRIGSAYHYGTCGSGQWTTFAADVNSQSAVGTLIEEGNPAPLSIGDPSWIQPGTKTASYKDLDDKYPTPSGSAGHAVSVVVVDSNDLSQKGLSRVVAFAGFRITDVVGGSGKYIQGSFVNGVTTSGSSGIGPFFGAFTPPRLAQ